MELVREGCVPQQCVREVYLTYSFFRSWILGNCLDAVRRDNWWNAVLASLMIDEHPLLFCCGTLSAKIGRTAEFHLPVFIIKISSF